MTISYEIKVNAARTATEGQLENVVKEVDWTITGTDAGQSFSLPNKTTLNSADPGDFIPYANTTEADMVGWIESAEPRLDAIKAHVQIVVERMVAEASLESPALPWAPEPAPEPAAEVPPEV